MPRAPTPQKAVVNHLARQAALKVKHQRRARQPRDAAADEGALVHVRVNHVGPEVQRRDERCPRHSASKANLWREEPTS